MRVFITGASGFVGSFFLKLILSSGKHDVAVLLKNPESVWRIKDCLQQTTIIKGDLTDLPPLEKEVKAFKPDAFVHLAWNGVMGSNRNDVNQWRNVPQALHLVEMASQVGAMHWVGLGSQAEYGQCPDKVNESTVTNPTTLYGVSKLAACNLANRLCKEIGIRFAWLRLFSSYGPTDNPGWMIPYVIDSLLAGRKPRLTSAEQLWDYIYVEDAATSIAAVLDSDKAEGIFNLGSGKAFKLRTVIEMIRDRIDPSLPLGFGEIPYRTDQVMCLEADITRLKKLTGWIPKVGIEEGLDKTIRWRMMREIW